MKNYTIIIICCLSILWIIKKMYIYFKLRLCKAKMKKNKDNSEILYWNNKNILLTENYIYIDKIKYNYEDIAKVYIKRNFFYAFIVDTRSIIKKPTITTYHIYLKNNFHCVADDKISYYKGKYISIKNILKSKNITIIKE